MFEPPAWPHYNHPWPSILMLLISGFTAYMRSHMCALKYNFHVICEVAQAALDVRDIHHFLRQNLEAHTFWPLKVAPRGISGTHTHTHTFTHTYTHIHLHTLTHTHTHTYTYTHLHTYRCSAATNQKPDMKHINLKKWLHKHNVI